MTGNASPEKLQQKVNMLEKETLQAKKTPEEELLRIRKAVESSSDAIGMSDPQGRHFYQNKAFTELFEYTAKELDAAGGGPAVYVDPRIAQEVFETIMGGKSWIGEIEMVSKSGRKFPVFLRADAIKDDAGKIIGLIGVHTDITERKRADDAVKRAKADLERRVEERTAELKVANEKLKAEIEERRQAEEALRQNEEKYRTILENIEDAYYENDLSGTLTFYNDALCRLSGYSEEELNGMNYRKFMGNKTAEDAFKAYNSVYTTGTPVRGFEAEIIRKDGSRRNVESSISLIRDSEGRPIGFRGISRDITDRINKQRELKESEEKYRRTILENIEDGYFEVDLAGNLTSFNDSMCRIAGFSRDELMGMNNREYTDTETAKKMYQVFNEVYRTGQPARMVDYEMIRKDGSKRILELSTSLIRGSAGAPIGFRGIARDVTERKQTEKALKDTLERLRKGLGGTIQAMALIVETRDPYTAGHQRRVANLARAISSEMGLSNEEIEGIRIAGIIHDMGKILVPAEILSKPGRLTENEFGIIKSHPQVGYDILNNIDFPWPVAEIVLQHHERLDGSGYPQGLLQDKTLLEAKILAVADVVEAMASHRPYRPALGVDKALEEISRNSGTLYDPEVVDACLRLFNEKGFRL
jgi:PAS domain S-box-containing protein/putative nucleotidyltransferase with HDIG domain